ncbi:BnaC03g12520D [Brassica napus]|uniref:BnaC03g12520D protein n=1 Tax=Brassica napus TaxID=3708 RepID=A0A078J6F0_BRANA|nr:BnaC03g12520D [Brassica napus]
MGRLCIWRTLILLSLFVKQAKSQDPNTDASHLSNFFNQMSSSPKAYTFSSLCSSPGVVCDRQKQNVLHFSASGSDLSGAIPENTIGKMIKLQSLDLSRNKITSLPSDLWSLDSLEHLNLSSNLISDPLPSNIGNFVSLQTLDLSFNTFSGEIPASISSLVGLTTLDLSNNGFQSVVPPGLLNCRSLVSIDLSSNRLTGSLLAEFGSAFPELKSLNLSRNLLQGSFPQILKLSGLYYLNLSRTNLAGSIPSGITQLSQLKVLDLSYNNLTGNVPLLPLKNIEVLDLSLNKLEGDIPRTVLEKLPVMERFNFSFNNLTFCDPNLSQGMIQTSFIGSTNNCPFAAKPNVLKGESVSKKKTGLKIGLTLAISMAFLLVALLVILVAMRGRRKSRTWATKQAAEPNLLDQGDSSTYVPVVMIDKPLMKMTLADLKAATLNFDSGALLWESKSGPTYEAVLPGGFRAALKVVSSGATLSDHEASVTFERLARINHPNLVPLSGYCIAAEQRIVIYEHLEYVNLHTLLHNTDDSLSWILRHKIALGTARALAFLHHGCIPPVVHGEVKAGTIFLDSSQEPQLAEFGLAKLLNEGLLGDLDGYTPTELEEHGSPTLESDAYSFGVVLLELVSGKKAEWDLVDWVRGLVRQGEGSRAIDPTLQGTGPVEQIAEAVKIGYLCTADLSWKRPTMQQVVGLLKDISPS